MNLRNKLTILFFVFNSFVANSQFLYSLNYEDGFSLISNTKNKQILFNLKENKVDFSFSTEESIRGNYFSMKDNYYISYSGYGTICKRDIKTHKILNCIPGTEGNVRRAVFIENGKKIIVSRGNLKSAKLFFYLSQNGEVESEYSEPNLYNFHFLNNSLVVLEYKDGSKYSLFDIQSKIHKLDFNISKADNFCIDENKKRLACISNDNRIIVFDVQKHDTIKAIDSNNDEKFGYIAISPDGKYLAYTIKNKLTRIIEIETGRILHEYSDYKSIYHLKFEKDNYLHIICDYYKYIVIEVPNLIYTVNTNFNSDIVKNEKTYTENCYCPIIDEKIKKTKLEAQNITSTLSNKVLNKEELKDNSNNINSQVQLSNTANKQPVTVDLGKPEIVVNANHTNPITSICMSSNEEYYYSASTDNTIKCWEASTGKLIKTFVGHTSQVRSISISPDNKFLLSGSNDYTMKLWDNITGKVIRTFTGIKNKINSVSFSPDGKYALSGSSDTKNSLVLWDINSGEKIKVFNNQLFEVNSVCFSRDGNYALTGDKFDVKLWDIKKEYPKKIFQGHLSNVNSVCFSPDGKYALSGSKDKTIKLWDIETGTELKTYKTYKEEVSAVQFSPDGKNFLSGGGLFDGRLILWDVFTGNLISEFNKIGTPSISSICFTQDGKFALVGGASQCIEFWDIAKRKIIKKYSGNTDEIVDVSFSPDGKYILSGGKNSYAKSIKVWDASLGKVVNSFFDQTYYFVRYSPDGKLIMGSEISEIWIYDIASKSRILIRPDEYLQDAVFSPDGKQILVSAGNKLYLWDIPTKTKLRTFNGHADKIKKAMFSFDGKNAVSISYDYTIKQWDISTGTELKSISTGKYLSLESLAVSSDGKFVATGGYDDINIYDLSKGERIRKIQAHESYISSLHFCNDGTILLSASGDNTIKLFEVSTGNLLKTFSGHQGGVKSASFSPDEKKIVSCSEDNAIKIWDVNTEKNILSFCSYGDNWLVYTPDCYFDCTIGAGEAVSIVMNNHGYNIDQLGIKYNRPDIILNRLGNADTSLIAHYYNQYKKRLRKSGFTEKQLTMDIHIPLTTIINSKQEGKFNTITFSMSDDKFKIKSYSVFVNDVPIYGANGKPITDQKKLQITEKIELTNGLNKIEISCLNENGVESFRALAFASYNEVTKPDIYYLGFGVSKYKNSDLNLQFADKDATDIEKVIQGMKGKGFENVYTMTLINESVTPDAIKKAKDFAKNAKPDDTFVLFIAGHGMHDKDKEATYYYLTSNADPKNLKSTAADFETIEDLLQGIAPRNKLFLMDACESGEIDDEVQTNFITQANQKGIKSRGMKQTSSTTTGETRQSTPRSYLFQKDRYIYNDLVRRSGAVVFSSSKGGELSYERSDLENGLFTEYFLKALTTTEADKDKNGIVSTDELRIYISAEVAKESNELQHPTVDRDNIFQKFGLPIVK